MLEGMR